MKMSILVSLIVYRCGLFVDIHKPKACISIFCAEVKERCVAAVMLAVDIHSLPGAIAGTIESQLNDFNYIFPRHSKASPQRVRKHTCEVNTYPIG